MVWLGASSRASAMIGARGQSVQLRRDLAESPTPAAALWELLGEEQRRAAMVPLAALIAQTVAGEEATERE